MALIIGEAGIGKSRLVQRFHEQIGGTPHTWIEAHAGAFFQNTPFYPVTELLQQFLGGNGDKPAEDQLAQLGPRLELAGLKPAETIPLIAPLLNLPLSDKYPPLPLSPEQQRRRLLATLVEWVLGAARVQPLIVVTEDLHWADPSTLELIQLLVGQGARARLLLLYTARPEFHTQWPLRVHHTQLTLNRLNVRDIRTMVQNVAARNALSDETIATVVERTGGVPLFGEELTRAVLEGGGAKLTGREIPVTLHDSLMARLDRLGTAKEVAQLAAVIGAKVSYELLQAVSAMPESELQATLAKLADAELIYTRGIPPEATYQFKHALIRDTAYDALLKSRRRELHRLVAQIIDEKFPELKKTQPEVSARHWTEAGETDVAISLWGKIGDASRSRCAFREAYRAYQNALALMELLQQSRERDECELSIRTALTAVVQIIHGYSAPETIDVSARARALSDKVGNLGQLVMQALNRWAALSSAGDFIAAGRIAEEMFEFASRESDPVNLAYAHMAIMTSRYRLGDLVQAEQYFAGGRTFFDSEIFRRAPGAIAQTFGNASQVALLIGRADTARNRIRQAISRALDNDSPYDQAFAHFMAAMLHLMLREPQKARDSATSSLNLCDKHKFPQFAALSRIALGRARAELGDAHEGVELIRQGLAEMLATRNRNSISVYLHWLSEAQMFCGEISKAIEFIDKAINEEQLYFRPENLRLRAELRLKQGNIELAETGFRESIAFARSMGAKAWELRTTLSLARLLAEKGRSDEAHAMLADIYDGFREGFDTADLMDAKALLDELAT